MANNIKSINQLLGEKFYIPSFQRGYRWDKKQVKDLLEDIWEFFNIPKKDEGEFYCLQPIIVKKDNDKYRLIDGQQRLTTIFLILSYLDIYIKRYKYQSLMLKTLALVNYLSSISCVFPGRIYPLKLFRIMPLQISLKLLLQTLCLKQTVYL